MINRILHSYSCIIEFIDAFSLTRLINSIKYEHSCNILYIQPTVLVFDQAQFCGLCNEPFTCTDLECGVHGGPDPFLENRKQIYFFKNTGVGLSSRHLNIFFFQTIVDCACILSF